MKNAILVVILTANLVIGRPETTASDAGIANKKLQGVWTLVTVENTNSDGSKTLPYGEFPKGQLIFTGNESYALQILKADRPKIAANDKNKGTAEENAALVQGNNSHFGKYTVDEKTKTLTFHIQRAFYPNWENTTRQCSYSMEGNILKYYAANTTSGGSTTAMLIWKRE